MSLQQDDLKSISDGLALFFKDNPDQITVWLLTPNVYFDGTTPAKMILGGHTAKVAKFVRRAIAALVTNPNQVPVEI